MGLGMGLSWLNDDRWDCRRSKCLKRQIRRRRRLQHSGQPFLIFMKRREINVLPFHPFRSVPFDDPQESRRRRRRSASAAASSSLSYLEKINGNEIKKRQRRRNTWNCQRCLYEFNSIKKPFMPSKLMTYSKLIRDFYNSGLIRSTCRTSPTARL